MNLAELYSALSYGELSNLALAEATPGTIAEAARPRIVLFTNDALRKLYTRFVLKENALLVSLLEGVTFYQLLPRFAVNYTPAGDADDEEVRYLLDSPAEPFLGDVLRILSVHDSNGTKLGLNDEGDLLSLYTPQKNVLQVPYPVPDQNLSVVYQASHARLQGETEEPIELPPGLWGALRAYIAYKVYSAMNTADSTAKAQEHLRNYEAECLEAERHDSMGTSLSNTGTRFSDRGWI